MPKLNPSSNADIRYDDETGAIRSLFNSGFDTPSGGGDFRDSFISDEFLTANSEMFMLDGIDLNLVEEKEGSSQITCKYDQYHKNIPVYGAYINVTLAKADRQVVSSVNKIDYGIPAGFNKSQVRVSTDEALKIMMEILNKSASADHDYELHDLKRGVLVHNEPELFIYKNSRREEVGGSYSADVMLDRLNSQSVGEDDRTYLVWRIAVDTSNPPGYWAFFINTQEPGVVVVLNRRRYFTSRPAKIFWPDPVTSSGNTNLHRGSEKRLLDAERVDVTLENLDEPKGNSCTLSGKWVRISEKEHPVMKVPTSDSHFNYASNDRKFLSVMVYYYIDRLVEWLRSLDVPQFNRAITDPLKADAQGADGEDNSHFVVPVKGPVYLAFGEGGTPDASDPGVITHEFGHALHYFILGELIPAGSYEEGFNDFLSCVFRDRFNRNGFDRANPFPWDNNSTISWDRTRRCDMNYRFDDRQFKKYGFYQKGTVYATALWDVYLAIGGKSENPDERLKAAGEIAALYMDMLISVGDTSQITDLARGLVSCDQSRTGGANGEAIRDAFQRRGLVMN